jgi:transposase-like protein
MKKRIRFSEAVKKSNVKKIEQGKMTQSEVARLYGISPTSVGKWVRKYGILPKSEKVIIESESDYIALLDQNKRVESLERKVGQLHMELAYLKEVIDTASEDLSIDLEKKFGRL